MFYDVVLEGLKKFAGEIIGVILLIVAWRIFPGLQKPYGTVQISMLRTIAA